MSRIFQKLNLKTQHEILVLNAPSSFEPELASLAGVTIYRDLTQVIGQSGPSRWIPLGRDSLLERNLIQEMKGKEKIIH